MNEQETGSNFDTELTRPDSRSVPMTAREFEEALADLLGIEDGPYCGCISDEMVDGGSFKRGLERAPVSGARTGLRAIPFPPGAERVVSMINYKDRLLVATDVGVYELVDGAWSRMALVEADPLPMCSKGHEWYLAPKLGPRIQQCRQCGAVDYGDNDLPLTRT